jgi:hypothetical protein
VARSFGFALSGSLGLIALTMANGAVAQSNHTNHAAHDRQAEVAARGEQVMPFDLERTTHSFIKTSTGGTQRVVSDDGDEGQIGLIRTHLATESQAFGRGDFASPERIHGADMPGLAVLRQPGSALSVTYVDTPTGGQITYATSRPEVVAALHLWFDAQTSDHGGHAQH